MICCIFSTIHRCFPYSTSSFIHSTTHMIHPLDIFRDSRPGMSTSLPTRNLHRSNLGLPSSDFCSLTTPHKNVISLGCPAQCLSSDEESCSRWASRLLSSHCQSTSSSKHSSSAPRIDMKELEKRREENKYKLFVTDDLLRSLSLDTLRAEGSSYFHGHSSNITTLLHCLLR